MRNCRKNNTVELLYGNELMKNSKVSLCSIVRDCEKNLKRNIPQVERLRGLFKESEVIVFENDSKDETLSILKNWENRSPGVKVFSEKYQNITIPLKIPGNGNPYFSIFRIEKMAAYRNKYMQILSKNEFYRDFVIVIDLDISGFEIEGLINSFTVRTEWDCIAANGISLSSRFRRQYHDSYALIEKDKLDEIQTEESIKTNRIKYSSLRSGMPFVPVDSAFGGLAIYKWNSINNALYTCLVNNDRRVQCKSEHVGLHKSMIENGHSRIFINPSMVIRYRSVTPDFIIKKLKEKLSLQQD
jgi:glycosyltransferase involved in cell wall biosynthesis